MELKPQPSLAIVKIRQGAVEIVGRVICIVLAFVIFVCAAVVSSHTTFPDVYNVTDVNAARTLTHGGAGYIMFIVFLAMIWEGVVITLRFLNIPVVNRYIGIFLITDILVHFVFLLHWFGSTIGFLVSGSIIWPAFRRESGSVELGVSVDWGVIESASIATGVFCFFNLPLYICLSVWMSIWLFGKWQRKLDQQLRSGPTPRDTEELDPDKQDDDD